MVYKSWLGLRETCPIKIDRLILHAQDFDSFVNVRINLNNLDNAKNSLIMARGELNSMLGCLIQVLHDKTILKTETDRILFRWMVDNNNLLLKYIDDQERTLIIIPDKPYDKMNSSLGISRLTAYSNLLNNIGELVVYETLLKSISEYDDFEETDEIKKTPKVFLYILQEILELTISSSFGLRREKTSGGMRKGTVDSVPTQWTSLIRRSEFQERQQMQQDEDKEYLGNLPLELTDDNGSYVNIIESDEGEDDV